MTYRRLLPSLLFIPALFLTACSGHRKTPSAAQPTTIAESSSSAAAPAQAPSVVTVVITVTDQPTGPGSAAGSASQGDCSLSTLKADSGRSWADKVGVLRRNVGLYRQRPERRLHSSALKRQAVVRLPSERRRRARSDGRPVLEPVDDCGSRERGPTGKHEGGLLRLVVDKQRKRATPPLGTALLSASEN